MINLSTLCPVKLTHKIKNHKPLTLIGVYPREMKTCIDTKTCTQISGTAWSIVSEDQKQPKCPSAAEWINKVWLVCAMDHYSSIKRKVTFRNTDES